MAVLSQHLCPRQLPRRRVYPDRFSPFPHSPFFRRPTPSLATLPPLQSPRFSHSFPHISHTTLHPCDTPNPSLTLLFPSTLPFPFSYPSPSRRPRTTEADDCNVSKPRKRKTVMSLISVINMQSVAGFGSGSHRGDGVIEEGEPHERKKRKR